MNLIQNEEVPNDIRFEAVKAFSATTLTPDIRNDALTYFRQQAADPKSEMLRQSLLGLAKLGTPQDRILIINYAKGANFENSIIAVSTIKNTGMLEARDTLHDIALDTTKNPLISQLAVDSLSVFANKYKDQRSKQLLVKIPVIKTTKVELQKRVVTTPQ